jgi:RNA-binding protein Nova
LIIGSIIGKGGSVINQLNATTGAKIKVSQNGEFFPTTNDRVLALSGSQETIGAAITEIVTKMIEVRDRQSMSSVSIVVL